MRAAQTTRKAVMPFDSSRAGEKPFPVIQPESAEV
jgi:hypothetical protein